MNEQVKNLIESVESYNISTDGIYIAGSKGKWIPRVELDRVVEELTKWNKVEDGLPEIGQKVLVKCSTGNVTISSRYTFGYYDHWKGSATFTKSIIAWKPID